MRINKSIFLILVSVLFNACGVKKFIPEDRFLYTGAELTLNSQDEIAGRKELRTRLLGVIEPEPNSKFLGAKFGLYWYYKGQQENPSFISKFMSKKFGEEPVYLSDADPFETEELIKNRLENTGYFYSRVTHSINRNQKRKTAKILYKAQLPEEPYVIATYQMDNDSLPIYQVIQKTMDETLLDKGNPYDLGLLKLERERIDAKLKDQGYYNFSSNFLIFEADTNQYDRKRMDLFLRLKEDVPQEGIKPYVVTEVNVYPNFVIGADSLQIQTTRFNGKNYIQDEEFFGPDKLDPFILLEEGERYNPTASGKTSRRLTSIGTYKFVNIRYEVIDSLSTDSLGYLQANIYLSPLTRRAIRAELQAVTKSNNFAGPHLALTYSNRNMFHGGEILSLTAGVGYERQLSGKNEPGLSSTQLSFDADIIYPRMLFPINIDENWFRYSIPKSRTGLGFEYLNRTKLFSLFSVNGEFGYLWQSNRFITHDLSPFSVHYIKKVRTSPEFEDILKANPFLQSSFNQQFIAGLTYSFIYNEMVEAIDKHQFFVNANLDLAGNTLDLISNGPTPKKFLGLEFAQYLKIDGDFRYHFNFGREQTLAARMFAGIGIPYGNSEVMPYSRQYFAGGPYSVRAFQIRRLGPGTYQGAKDGDPVYYDRTGNIRLEANLEYRFPLYQFLKGAFFVDAGNIWNSKTIPTDLEGGEFGPDFLSELGIGTGAGLRIDIQSFVIRFDLAFPVHSPGEEVGERWKFEWQDPVLNFAIGYPF